MSLFIRLLTLLTIAAAGFALPLSCAQGAAIVPIAIEQPAGQATDLHVEISTNATSDRATQSTLERLLDRLPPCGDGPTTRVAEQPATFATQPFVPGYLVSPIELVEQSTVSVAPPPDLIPIDSRAGPPDAPPPKSIG